MHSPQGPQARVRVAHVMFCILPCVIYALRHCDSLFGSAYSVDVLLLFIASNLDAVLCSQLSHIPA